jgi:hypothetical protein
MSNEHTFIKRYWSLLAAIFLPIVEFPCEGFIRLFADYEVARAVLSVICIALLVHSWFIQRRYVQNRWRLAFFTVFVSFVILGPVWLGLNVLRAHCYPLNWSNHEVTVYSNICELQYRIEQFAKVLGIIIAIWIIGDAIRRLIKRFF